LDDLEKDEVIKDKIVAPLITEYVNIDPSVFISEYGAYTDKLALSALYVQTGRVIGSI